ncbi:arad-like aldolase/epimerase [Hypoxylon sp. EC38]|nr:arad-like aldolase/epimerase [Hypoxylon sp. EC38]
MAPSAITETISSTLTLRGQEKLADSVVRTAVEAKEKTPLEAISHGILMPGIPTFPTYTSHRRHILVHMAATFRFFARCGFTEGQSGHISVRDPEFNGLMWMNPLGRHFGMLTAGDMICLDIATGKIVGGNVFRPANAAGYLILEMLNQDVCNFYDAHAVYARYGGIVFAAEEGEHIAAALGDKNKGVILMNHGLLTVGSTVDEAGFMFGLMDRACAMQLQVEAAAANGIPKQIISDEEAAYNFKMASEANVLYREAQPDIEYEIETAGGEDALARGFENLRIAP